MLTSFLGAVVAASLATTPPSAALADTLPASATPPSANEWGIVSIGIFPLASSNRSDAMIAHFGERGYAFGGGSRSAVLRGSIRYEMELPFSVEAVAGWGFQGETASFEEVEGFGAPRSRNVSVTDFDGALLLFFDRLPIRVGGGPTLLARDWTAFSYSCRCTVVGEGTYHLSGWTSVAVLHVPWRDLVFGEVRAQAGNFRGRAVKTGYISPGGAYEAGGMLFSVEAGVGLRTGQDRRSRVREH